MTLLGLVCFEVNKLKGMQSEKVKFQQLMMQSDWNAQDVASFVHFLQLEHIIPASFSLQNTRYDFGSFSPNSRARNCLRKQIPSTLFHIMDQNEDQLPRINQILSAILQRKFHPQELPVLYLPHPVTGKGPASPAECKSQFPQDTETLDRISKTENWQESDVAALLNMMIREGWIPDSKILKRTRGEGKSPAATLEDKLYLTYCAQLPRINAWLQWISQYESALWISKKDLEQLLWDTKEFISVHDLSKHKPLRLLVHFPAKGNREVTDPTLFTQSIDELFFFGSTFPRMHEMRDENVVLQFKLQDGTIWVRPRVTRLEPEPSFWPSHTPVLYFIS